MTCLFGFFSLLHPCLLHFFVVKPIKSNGNFIRSIDWTLANPRVVYILSSTGYQKRFFFFFSFYLFNIRIVPKFIDLITFFDILNSAVWKELSLSFLFENADLLACHHIRPNSHVPTHPHLLSFSLDWLIHSSVWSLTSSLPRVTSNIDFFCTWCYLFCEHFWMTFEKNFYISLISTF